MFFIFMEEFRKEFTELHLVDNSIATVGKAAGEKWKALSEVDTASCVAKLISVKMRLLNARFYVSNKIYTQLFKSGF